MSLTTAAVLWFCIASFVIVFGYHMPTILLRKSRWKTSILWFLFSSNVQIPHWYRNILVMNASKYFTLRIRGNFLLVTMFSYFLKAALARPFLLAMSLSVSSFEPRSMMSFQLSSPLCKNGSYHYHKGHKLLSKKLFLAPSVFAWCYCSYRLLWVFP